MAVPGLKTNLLLKLARLLISPLLTLQKVEAVAVLVRPGSAAVLGLALLGEGFLARLGAQGNVSSL